MVIPEELRDYLYQHIPLSAAMQVQVLQATSATVRLGAPLAPNINHRDTVFGGSASALAILAAWSILYVRLKEAGFDSRVVIQRNEMHYDKPIPGDFEAVATVDEGDWQRFIKILQRRHRARISVASVLECDGEQVGQLAGDFVAINV